MCGFLSCQILHKWFFCCCGNSPNVQSFKFVEILFIIKQQQIVNPLIERWYKHWMKIWLTICSDNAPTYASATKITYKRLWIEGTRSRHDKHLSNSLITRTGGLTKNNTVRYNMAICLGVNIPYTFRLPDYTFSILLDYTL